jgi:hypothetical protein
MNFCSQKHTQKSHDSVGHGMPAVGGGGALMDSIFQYLISCKVKI